MEPLAQLFDEAAGEPLPLPPELLELHGPLRMPARPDRPHVFTNFVTSLDGIVSVDPPRGSGAEISGGNAQDRALMGLLRAVADAVVVSAGNLRAEGAHLWTAEHICPELAGPYARLRASLGKPPAPLQVVVTGGGALDLSRPVFSGRLPALVVTTASGAEKLAAHRATAPVAVAPQVAGWISLRAVLGAAGLGGGARVLVESGPTSTSRYVAEGAVDELFLTRAPILVGRAQAPPTLGLVEGRVFRPGAAKARLLSARRGGDFLFLRYALG
jgi:riboflavin biosynthesis pyrimidine reductase